MEKAVPWSPGGAVIGKQGSVTALMATSGTCLSTGLCRFWPAVDRGLNGLYTPVWDTQGGLNRNLLDEQNAFCLLHNVT